MYMYVNTALMTQQYTILAGMYVSSFAASKRPEVMVQEVSQVEQGTSLQQARQ